MLPGGGLGTGGDRDVYHILRYPPYPSHLLQVPWEILIGVRQLLAGVGAQPLMGMTALVASVQGVEQVGHGCPDLGENLCDGGSGGSIVWVVSMGVVIAHWEDSGQIL